MHSVLKVVFRIFLFVGAAFCFLIGTMIFKKYSDDHNISVANENINVFKLERDQLYKAESAAFEGTVFNLTPGLHRGSIDTVSIKLSSFTGIDSSFGTNPMMQKVNDSTLRLFIVYEESIWNGKINIGDIIKKNAFDLDFAIYDAHQKFKNKLNLLFCDYQNPDTIVQVGSLAIGLYGNTPDTLFTGELKNGQRNGFWRYHQPYKTSYKYFEGTYAANQRNGVFRKYYENTNQLMFEENYKNNLPEGKFTWWYINGKLESKKYFSVGKPIGIWEYYDKNGKLIGKQDYGNKSLN